MKKENQQTIGQRQSRRRREMVGEETARQEQEAFTVCQAVLGTEGQAGKSATHSRVHSNHGNSGARWQVYLDCTLSKLLARSMRSKCVGRRQTGAVGKPIRNPKSTVEQCPRPIIVMSEGVRKACEEHLKNLNQAFV